MYSDLPIYTQQASGKAQSAHISQVLLHRSGHTALKKKPRLFTDDSSSLKSTIASLIHYESQDMQQIQLRGSQRNIHNSSANSHKLRLHYYIATLLAFKTQGELN